jgi:hypothetical protein
MNSAEWRPWWAAVRDLTAVLRTIDRVAASVPSTVPTDTAHAVQEPAP